MNLTFAKQSCCFAALISGKYYNDARHQWGNRERALHSVQGRIQDFGKGDGAQNTSTRELNPKEGGTLTLDSELLRAQRGQRLTMSVYCERSELPSDSRVGLFIASAASILETSTSLVPQTPLFRNRV